MELIYWQLPALLKMVTDVFTKGRPIEGTVVATRSNGMRRACEINIVLGERVPVTSSVLQCPCMNMTIKTKQMDENRCGIE